MFKVPSKRGAKLQGPFDNGEQRVFVIQYNEKVESVELELQSSRSDSLTGRTPGSHPVGAHDRARMTRRASIGSHPAVTLQSPAVIQQSPIPWARMTRTPCVIRHKGSHLAVIQQSSDNHFNVQAIDRIQASSHFHPVWVF